MFYYSDLKEENKDEVVRLAKNIETFKWGHMDFEPPVHENETWLELEDKKAIEREKNDMLHLKSIILKDLNNLKTKVNQFL